MRQGGGPLAPPLPRPLVGCFPSVGAERPRPSAVIFPSPLSVSSAVGSLSFPFQSPLSAPIQFDSGRCPSALSTSGLLTGRPLILCFSRRSLPLLAPVLSLAVLPPPGLPSPPTFINLTQSEIHTFAPMIRGREMGR